MRGRQHGSEIYSNPKPNLPTRSKRPVTGWEGGVYFAQNTSFLRVKALHVTSWEISPPGGGGNMSLQPHSILFTISIRCGCNFDRKGKFSFIELAAGRESKRKTGSRGLKGDIQNLCQCDSSFYFMCLCACVAIKKESGQT